MIKDGMVSINYEDELIQSILINTSQKIGSDVTFLNMSQTLRPTEKSFNKTITDIVFQSNISNDQNMIVDTNKNYLSDNTDDDRPLHPAGIISTRNDYYTIPSLDKIAELVDVGNDECIIEDLIIGREGYGMLKFPGKTNVMNLNIDRDIYFKKRKVSIYTDNTNKPPRGTALNKECNITLFNVYPASRKQKDIKVDLNERDLKLFIDKLKGECKRWDAKYVNYDYEKGSWSFIVKHFSEYGFEDSEDSTSSISVQDLENDNSQEYSNNSFGLSDTKSQDSNILNCSTSINFSDLNYSIIESENLSEKTDVDMKTNSNDYKRFKHGAPYVCQMMNFTNNLLYISQDNKISTQQSDINPLKCNNFFSQDFPYQIQNIFNNINNKSLNDSILSLEKSANDLNSEFDALKSSIKLIKMLYIEDNESNTSFYEMLNDYLIEINSLLLENIDPDQIATDNSDSKKLLYSIKVLISIGDIKAAAEIVKNQFNSPRLSFLLLGCRNNKKCQQIARQQLLFWHQDDLLKLIPSHIVELYLLISGTSTWSSVYNLNICKDLIWTQSFAIYLNYACNNSMSKSEIVQNFLEWYSLPNLMNIKVSNNLENDLSFIAEKPLPLHIYTDKPNLEHENLFQIIKDFIDIRYSLLKFFVYQSIDLINLEYHCFSKYRVVGMISSSIIGSFIMKNIKYLPKLFEASQHNLIKLSINLQQYGLIPFSAIILDQLQNEILFRTYADAMIMQNYYRITENPELLMNMNLSQRFKELISANLVSSTDHSLNIIQILNKSLLYSPRFVQDMMNNLFIVLALNDSSLISQLSKTISHFISNSGLKNISLINQLYLLVGILDDFSLQLSNNLPDQNYLNLAQKVDQCQLLETETKVLIFSKIYEDCRFRFPVDVCV
ncbi:MAG: Nuclear pore complex protein Nup98-Nup96 [Paramarteilia canceri]